MSSGETKKQTKKFIGVIEEPKEKKRKHILGTFKIDCMFIYIYNIYDLLEQRGRKNLLSTFFLLCFASLNQSDWLVKSGNGPGEGVD